MTTASSSSPSSLHQQAFEIVKRTLAVDEFPLDYRHTNPNRVEEQMWKCLRAVKFDPDHAIQKCRDVFEWRNSFDRTHGRFGAETLQLYPFPDGYVKGYDESSAVMKDVHGGHRTKDEDSNVINSEYVTRVSLMQRLRRETYPANWHKWDKEGRPTFFERTSKVQPKRMVGLLKALGQPHGWGYIEAAERVHVTLTEIGEMLCRYQTTRLCRPIHRVHIVIDVNELKWSQLHMPAMDILRHFAYIDQKYYPETLGRVSVIHCPHIFNVFWFIVRTWLDVETRKRVFLIDSESTPEYLDKCFDKQHLPDYLGGSCRCSGG
eukprot:PhM_4_TR8352/c0_g1_i1/m.69585